MSGGWPRVLALQLSVDGCFSLVLVVVVLVRRGVGGGAMTAALTLSELDVTLSAECQVELR